MAYYWQLLRYSQSELSRQMSRMQQMVLQRPRQHIVLTHRQPSSARSPQGGTATSQLIPRRYRARMLQLRNEECLSSRFHTRTI